MPPLPSSLSSNSGTWRAACLPLPLPLGSDARAQRALYRPGPVLEAERTPGGVLTPAGSPGAPPGGQSSRPLVVFLVAASGCDLVHLECRFSEAGDEHEKLPLRFDKTDAPGKQAGILGTGRRPGSPRPWALGSRWAHPRGFRNHWPVTLDTAALCCFSLTVEPDETDAGERPTSGRAHRPGARLGH